MYPLLTRLRELIDRGFTYRSPGGNQVERYESLRDHARALAQLIAQTTPPSREQTLAITKIEESIMWANAAIARNEYWQGGSLIDQGGSSLELPPVYGSTELQQRVADLEGRYQRLLLRVEAGPRSDLLPPATGRGRKPKPATDQLETPPQNDPPSAASSETAPDDSPQAA